MNRGGEIDPPNLRIAGGSNKNGTLIKYEDAVRAMHVLKNNNLLNAGEIIRNKYVADTK